MLQATTSSRARTVRASATKEVRASANASVVTRREGSNAWGDFACRSWRARAMVMARGGVARETGERMTWDLAGDVVARVWIADGRAMTRWFGARSRADGGARA